MMKIMPPTPLDAVLYGVLGLALGWAHFGLLCWNTRLYVTAGRAHAAFAVQLLRFAGVAAALALIARVAGAWPLLITVAGLQCARQLVLRRMRAS